jgi:peptidyl-prolyl cis-trans isomerase SurA
MIARVLKRCESVESPPVAGTPRPAFPPAPRAQLSCLTYTSCMPYRGTGRWLAASSALAVCSLVACRPAAKAPVFTPTAETWAVVDGHEITRGDVDKAYRRMRDPAATLSAEEIDTAKLNLLNDLILQEILLQRATTLKLEVAQSDLDAAYADTKKSATDEAFQRQLTERSMTPDDLREGLRREMTAQKVVAQAIAPKLEVTDQEVNDAFSANRAQFNVPEESYHIAQIVVTPVREAQVANATGDDAATPEQAAAKVKMLMERLNGGASFRDLAVGYSEDPESAQRGGDLGLVPVSRLRQAPPQLRDAVLNKAPGSVNVVNAGGAYTIVLVAAHEPAGQRDLSTPGVRDRIRDTLKARKEQLYRSAYLTAARSDATVVNYQARRLIEPAGPAAPNLTPGAPGRR